MKKVLEITSLLLISSLLVSCSTSSFMGLSKAKYVDEELQKIVDASSELEKIGAQIDELSTLNNRIDEVNKVLEDTQASEAEMQERMNGLESLTGTLEIRLNEIPRDTLGELRDAIDMHLQTTDMNESDSVVEEPVPEVEVD